MPEVSKGFLEDLHSIRRTFELVFNERAVMVRPGVIDGSGTVTPAAFEPRWELWDTDPEGARYRVLTLQTSPMDDPVHFPDGGRFKPPGEWILDHLRFINPERFNGNLNDLLHEAIDEPERLREVGTEKDSDDLIEMSAKWAAWVTKPKERNLKTLEELGREHATWQAERGRLRLAATSASTQEA